jgi:hypothetical protein
MEYLLSFAGCCWVASQRAPMEDRLLNQPSSHPLSRLFNPQGQRFAIPQPRHHLIDNRIEPRSSLHK